MVRIDKKQASRIYAFGGQIFLVPKGKGSPVFPGNAKRIVKSSLKCSFSEMCTRFSYANNLCDVKFYKLY